jgi:hypothetical protein
LPFGVIANPCGALPTAIALAMTAPLAVSMTATESVSVFET